MSDTRDIVERLRDWHVDPDEVMTEAADEITRLRAALAAQVPQWQPIETAPKDGRKIIVSYVNHNGKTRTVMARWLTQEAADEIDHEGVGLEAGWFECIDNWGDYTEVAIHEGEPTHWMPLPAAPGASPPAALAVPDAKAIRAQALEEAAKLCDVTPPYPFRPSIEAAHAIRKLAASPHPPAPAQEIEG